MRWTVCTSFYWVNSTYIRLSTRNSVLLLILSISFGDAEKRPKILCFFHVSHILCKISWLIWLSNGSFIIIIFKIELNVNVTNNTYIIGSDS